MSRRRKQRASRNDSNYDSNYNGNGSNNGVIVPYIRHSRKQIHLEAKTNGQDELITSISHNKLTICVGPAGTGKT